MAEYVDDGQSGLAIGASLKEALRAAEEGALGPSRTTYYWRDKTAGGRLSAHRIAIKSDCGYSMSHDEAGSPNLP